MTTRRGLMATAALAGAALSMKTALAQAQQADFLFVQNATSMRYADGKLTLVDVSPVTIFFSDRPERIAGNMATQVSPQQSVGNFVFIAQNELEVFYRPATKYYCCDHKP